VLPNQVELAEGAAASGDGVAASSHGAAAAAVPMQLGPGVDSIGDAGASGDGAVLEPVGDGSDACAAPTEEELQALSFKDDRHALTPEALALAVQELRQQRSQAMLEAIKAAETAKLEEEARVLQEFQKLLDAAPSSRDVDASVDEAELLLMQLRYWLRQVPGDAAVAARVRAHVSVLMDRLSSNSTASAAESDAPSASVARESLLHGLSSVEVESMDQCAPFIDPNPRRIKRLLNIYNMARLLIEPSNHAAPLHFLGDDAYSLVQQMAAAAVLPLNTVYVLLFRIIVLLEQWPVRAVALLHLAQRAQARWLHVRQRLLQETRAASGNDSDVDTAFSLEHSLLQIPAAELHEAGLFPPRCSLLELYEGVVRPLLSDGHCHDADYEPELGLSPRPATNASVGRAGPAGATAHSPRALAHPRAQHGVTPSLSLSSLALGANSSPSPLSALPPVSLAGASVHSSTRASLILSLQSLATMDSDPESFSMFLAAPVHLDEPSAQGEAASGSASDSSPSRLTLLHLSSLSYVAVNLNPALKKQIGALVDFLARQTPCTVIVDKVVRAHRANDSTRLEEHESVESGVT
jgi:hypothetical protein